MNDLGNRIRHLRGKAGLTVGDLAEKLGKSAGYISRIETRDDEIPSPEFICTLASVLSTQPEPLLNLAKKVMLQRTERQITQKHNQTIALYRKSK